MKKPPKKKVQKKDVYVGELGRMVNRRPDTIRIWIYDDWLPKELLPSRNSRNNRLYWSEEQAEGILQWMKDNDMRPGPMFTDPDDEGRHITNMRHPRYLNGTHIKSARTWTETGKSREYILRTLLPRTRYANERSLKKALVRVAADQGWKLPRSAPIKQSKAVQKEIVRLKKLTKSAEALTKEK